MMQENNAPNLDCLSVDPADVWAVWTKVHFAERETAREWFPDRPKGYVRATRDLGNYAANKATAMRCRLSGDIVAATKYETICDRIYEQLPAFARW